MNEIYDFSSPNRIHYRDRSMLYGQTQSLSSFVVSITPLQYPILLAYLQVQLLSYEES